MANMPSGILVFAEQRAGAMKRSGLEAISCARALAAQGLGPVAAVIVGEGLGAAAAEAGKAGIDRLLLADHKDLALYAPAAYAGALAAAVKLVDPAAVLLPASTLGKDLAARLAARISTPLVPDVVELAAAGGTLTGRRPVYSSKAIATFEVACPAIVTLRPNVFRIEPGAGGAAPAPETLAYAPGPDDLKSRVTEVLAPEEREIDVAEAQIVVSGGRGLREPANFEVVRKLAAALGGAVGASRAVVDAGWIEHAHQVGQTGKVVSPPLYIAIGISGAIQHLAGMSSSRVIVAVNKDPEAPIFKVANYGIVGDLFEVVPRMTEAVEKLRS
jgi:electron transfer flavoprotein alpha subunit